MDRGAWPFVVGGIVCLVTSVSVCTERGREKREKEETRNKNVKQTFSFLSAKKLVNLQTKSNFVIFFLEIDTFFTPPA